ncbi:unnamed protein product [Caenorhabditis bovis]|uniref:Uncharacterized protein n=1 Tax=Caenorhabditis bovis TaxID=2654633 RepID=A0A8S1EA26_9PELO|nr:unnamed protein product [Caenorhabditis bovis]
MSQWETLKDDHRRRFEGGLDVEKVTPNDESQSFIWFQSTFAKTPSRSTYVDCLRKSNRSKRTKQGGGAKRKSKSLESTEGVKNHAESSSWRKIVDQIMNTIIDRVKSTRPATTTGNNFGDAYAPINDDDEPDVQADYDPHEKIGSAEPTVRNNENNGRLIVNGVPFWCWKRERPQVEFCKFLDVVKAAYEKKFKPLDLLEKPANLDPFNTMEEMQSRDDDYFTCRNRIQSNTLLSLIGVSAAAICHETLDDFPVCQSHNITFKIPHKMVNYNRKNRFQKEFAVFYPNCRELKKKEKKSSVQQKSKSKEKRITSIE